MSRELVGGRSRPPSLFADCQELAARDVFAGRYGAARPAHVDALGSRVGAEAEVQAHIVVAVIARLAEHGLRLGSPAGGHTDGRAEGRPVRQAPFQLHADPVIWSRV